MNVTLKAILKAHVSLCYKNNIKTSIRFQEIELIFFNLLAPEFYI